MKWKNLDDFCYILLIKYLLYNGYFIHILLLLLLSFYKIKKIKLNH